MLGGDVFGSDWFLGDQGRIEALSAFEPDFLSFWQEDGDDARDGGSGVDFAAETGPPVDFAAFPFSAADEDFASSPGPSAAGDPRIFSDDLFQAELARDEARDDAVDRSGGAEIGLPPGVEIGFGLVTPSDDPLYGFQWHLENTGQTGGTPGVDINVLPVWPDYTGAGVVVGIIDSGVQYTHPDLAANYDTTIDQDFLGGDFDPMPDNSSSNDAHGTAVAGVIAAADNGIGVVGVSPEATITGFRMGFGSEFTISQLDGALGRLRDVDIGNNSWGFGGFFSDDFNSSFFATSAANIADAVSNGRGGLGTVITFSAGNSRADGQDVNYHNFQNSRFTIAAAAIDDTGQVSSFSTPGAALLVAAPGEQIGTTDQTGADGFVPNTARDIDPSNPNAHPDYTAISGTSFSSPITAATAALMLEANPSLGYRDVQEILAYSAVQTGTGDWTYNGADNWNGGGLHVSHDYGFGLVDAHAAVRLAETWQYSSALASGDPAVRNEASVSVTSSPGAAIPDMSFVSDTVTVASSLSIDFVEVDLNLSHNFIGDLVVTLTSPDGTESVLVNRPGNGGASQNNINFTLTTTRDWGEIGNGDWTLTVQDQDPGTSGTLNSWTLTLYGDNEGADDVYIYTDEFSGLGGDPARLSLDDPAGTDTINAAAVTTDSTLDLRDGGVSTIAGNPVTLTAGTVIENAFAGDGNDTIIGNAAANDLYGGRGADLIFGGDGGDLLRGGAGNDQLSAELGDDTVMGGEGDDYLWGGAGNDTLSGDDGPSAPAGADWLMGMDGDDTLYGYGGNDVLYGQAGTDTLMGGDGNDLLFPGSTGAGGQDLLVGGDGDDTFYIPWCRSDVVGGCDAVVDETETSGSPNPGTQDTIAFFWGWEAGQVPDGFGGFLYNGVQLEGAAVGSLLFGGDFSADPDNAAFTGTIDASGFANISLSETVAGVDFATSVGFRMGEIERIEFYDFRPVDQTGGLAAFPQADYDVFVWEYNATAGTSGFGDFEFAGLF